MASLKPVGSAVAETEVGSLAGVVIGRNEGKRLAKVLTALIAQVPRTIYVDSGSRDDSVAIARGLGVRVVELDAARPFCAARARNAGLEALSANPPDLVQFIDGDCVVQPGWIDTAKSFLMQNSEVAVVCGRRRERMPVASIFNQFADMEWDTPVGKAKTCGGDAMMRFKAVTEVGGFRSDLIAGEEPELCLRLRARNWKIWRLDTDMTRHDADITRPGAWLRRALRTGHAFAEGAALHGQTPERHYVTETRRALIWGAVLPVLALAATILHPAGFLVWLIYPAQITRLAMRLGLGKKLSWQYAFYLTLGKFAEAAGVLKFWLNRLSNRKTGLIEYQ